MNLSRFPRIEPLETRLAPAIILANPLADIIAGSGKTGATIDLSEMLDAGALYPNRTVVEFTTNVDSDPNTPGLQAGKIVIELFDDEAPLTVQNFIAYVNNKNAKGDYDNTIIHRSADFGTSSGPGNDIIQGGGFDVPGATSTHIPVGPETHNEFSNSRPNTRGTIAMAKTGLSPNTATSEWFFNVNDNSSILGDGNNGGFTVFGRVVSGMEIVDAIAGLTDYNFSGFTGSLGAINGAFGEVPLQNYNANPDNNASTPAPMPKGDQFIRIVDAKVLPTTGNTSGVTFSVDSMAPVDDTPADLLTATVSGQTLNLKYKAGRSGFVDVTVKATPDDGSEPVLDTFRVDVRPNLIVNIDSDGFQGIIIPGDTATVKLHLTNNGAATAKGTVDLEIGLAKTSIVGGSLVINSPLEVVTLARLNDFDLNLAGGKMQSFSPSVQILTSLAVTEGQLYTVIARVVPEGDLATEERFSDDNIGLDGGRHELLNRFGTFSSINQTFSFGTRTNAVLSYGDLDANGNQTLVTWTMKGAGGGRVTPDSSGQVLLETFSTDAKSTLNVKVGKGAAHAVVERAEFLDTLGTANLGSVDLAEYLFASSGVKTLTLGNVQGQATMLIGAFPPDNTTKTTLKLGRVQDLSLESSMPIASLTAIDWLDTAGTPNDYINAIGLDVLKITGAHNISGSFEADLTNNSSSAITSLSVAGFVNNATIRTFGDIGTVKFGGMYASNLFLGVSERPDDVSDFGDALTLKSFAITGAQGFLLFIDSQVAAAKLGTIKVHGVPTGPGAGAFGFVADVITSYNRTGFKTASNVTLPSIIDEQGDYSAVVL